MTSKVIKISSEAMAKIEAYQQQLAKDGLKVSKQAALNYVITAFFQSNQKLPSVTNKDILTTESIKKDTKSIQKVTKKTRSSSRKTSSNLTATEQKALELKAGGLSNAEIAVEMGCVKSSVSGYITKAKRKKSIAELEAVE